MTIDRSKQCDEIGQACADIEQAVQKAQWDKVEELLSHRHRLLESAFAEPVTTAGDIEQLRALAEQVMAFDSELMPLADAARAEATEDLKKLRLGRNAAAAYKQTSG